MPGRVRGLDDGSFTLREHDGLSAAVYLTLYDTRGRSGSWRSSTARMPPGGPVISFRSDRMYRTTEVRARLLESALRVTRRLTLPGY